ncbi:MAG: Gfo/Idh/MocA family oxidoreductase [Acidimicrobiia bacterium]|nr:Gfo/Idh/MocA family oxidoreductase [Acidimicrobiia bacterium]
MKPVRFGVIGAGSFVANAAVIPAISRRDSSELVAGCSLGREPDPRWSAVAVDRYDSVLSHPDVEAVYIPLPNHLHLPWILACARAGKHVLCEKPLALTAAEARAAAQAYDEAGVLLAEAWMTPFHQRWRSMMAHVTSGQLGSATAVRTTFTFTIKHEDRDNYRFDPAMGGGALHDVGIYCLGPAVHLWGAQPATVEVTDQQHRNGIDLTTEFRLTWDKDHAAVGRCSFVEQEEQSIVVTCERGVIQSDIQAHTGGANATNFRWSGETAPGIEEERSVEIPNNDPYQAMVERFSQAVRGVREWPRPVGRSIEMMELMERIQEAGR